MTKNKTIKSELEKKKKKKKTKATEINDVLVVKSIKRNDRQRVSNHMQHSIFQRIKAATTKARARQRKKNIKSNAPLMLLQWLCLAEYQP